MIKTKFSCFWNAPDLDRNYRTAVSLHGHTNRSKESLHFLPQLADKCPLLQAALEKQCKKSNMPVNFERAYWTPPLTPRLAYETEAEPDPECGRTRQPDFTHGSRQH